MREMIERGCRRRQVGDELDFADRGTFGHTYRPQQGARLGLRPAQVPPRLGPGREGQREIEAAGEALSGTGSADADNLLAMVARQNARQKAAKQARPDDGDVEFSHVAVLRQSAPLILTPFAAYFARMSL
jgi:hypothetical protein